MNTTLTTSCARLKDLFHSPAQPVQTILRVLAAIFGGYALTYSALAALVLLLPWPKVDVVFFSALFPAPIYLAALLWAFVAPTGQRAWRDLLAATIAFGLLALVADWIR